MKEITISIIIIITIISFDVITQNYTKDSTQEVINQLEEINKNLKTGDIDKNKIKQESEKLAENWDEKNDKMAFYIEHDELEKVENSITSMINYIESEEYNLASNEIAKNIFVLKHIKDKYQFNLENIF